MPTPSPVAHGKGAPCLARCSGMLPLMLLPAVLFLAALPGCRTERKAEEKSVPAPPAAGGEAVPRLSDTVAPAALPHFNRAMALLEQRRYAEAQDAFAGALAEDPASIALIYGTALARYYQGGDLKEAAASMERLTRERPSLASPPFLLGHMRLKRAAPEAAMDAFLVAAKRFGRKECSIYYSLGLAAAAAKDLEAAAEHYRKSVETDPLFVSGWYSLGQTLVQAGKTEEGQEALRRFEKAREELWAEEFEFRYRGMGPLMLVPVPAPPQREEDPPPLPVFRQVPSPVPPASPPARTPELAAQACRFGAGAALFDADRDGDLDLYELRCPTDGRQGSTRLLLAESGGSCRDATAQSGAAFDGFPIGATAADFDGDGDQDLVVTHAEGIRYFENSGVARFRDATEERGISASGWCVSAVPVDFDQDGDLDLYVVRPGILSSSSPAPPAFPAPASNLLFRNDAGRFSEVAEAAGLAAPGRSLSSLWLDLDSDSDLDLVEPDLSGPTLLYLNQRDGTFVPAPEGVVSGLDLPDRVVAIATMDWNGDGLLDLAFSRWEGAPLELRFSTRSGARFVRPDWMDRVNAALPRAPAYGLAGANFTGTGRPGLVLSGQDAAWVVSGLYGRSPRVARLNLPGLGGEGGPGPRGIVVADIARTASEELLVSTGDGARMYFSEAAPPAGWLRVTLEGRMGSNRDGFGAVVDVRTGSLWQSRLVTPGSFLASGPPEVLLSFGAVGGVEFFRITWPSGIRQTAVDLEVGRALHMDEKGLNSS